MKLGSMRIYLVIGCVLAIAGAGALYWGAHYFFSINQVTVLYETPCSAPLAQDIDAFLGADKKSSYPQLAQKLKENFPAVTHVSFQTVPTHVCVAEIALSEPQVCLNDHKILCTNGGLMPMYMVEPTAITKVPLVQFDASEQITVLTTQEKKWLSEFSPALCQSYVVVWHDAYQIELIDKKDPWFGITTNIFVKPIDKLIQHCNVIKKKVEIDRLASTKKEQKNSHCMADIRFENQIIISAHKGGKVYGSII
jgi:hypothetical protein